MKASLRWLRELVELPEDPGEVAAALDRLGAEVEAVEHLRIPFDGVVVARVLTVAEHPDADRLRVVTVDLGSGEATMVCGAWNFEAGAIVAYAPPGSRLAGGLEVGEREIRGVRSPGMICSEAELGLGDDAEGIMVLGVGEAAIGSDLATVTPLPDVVFDVSITSNRPDLMSMHGLARDLAAFFGTSSSLPSFAPVEGDGSSGVGVRLEAPDRCPRFTAREIGGVTVGPSPMWMRARLRSVGVRPVSNVVDVTNYVMLELGQPLHAFDLDRVGEETIVVRTASEGEVLVTLDGTERALRPTDLVIADASRPIGLAGVMGGEEAEVSVSTSRVLLEGAHFEAGGVLLTGKHHGLRSEASSRFERGVDPELPPLASARATALIVELCGGAAVGELIDVYPEPAAPTVVSLAPAEVERLLGVAVPTTEIAGILERLGFDVRGDGPLEVRVPSYRPDVARPADLVEEVARLHGFDRIPDRLPTGPGGGLPPSERARRLLREVLIGAGYFETVSLDFVGIEEIEAMGYGPGDSRGRPVRIRNPVSDEQAHLRTTLLPGLLSGLRSNLMRNRRDAALFEVGGVFLPSDGPLPEQPHRVGFAAAGRSGGVTWEEAPERDALDASGMVEALFGAFGLGYELVPAVAPGMHPGRAAEVVVNGSVVGVIGEIHPDVADAWDLEGRVAAGEIDVSVFAGPRVRSFRAVSALPPVVLDMAFDTPAGVPASRLLGAVRDAAGSLLERLVVFDVFAGPPLDEGRRSIAVRLTFRDPERTLSDDDLIPIREAIASRVAETVDGRVRGG